MGSFPSQKFLSLGCICPESRQITVAAGTNYVRQFHTIDLLEGIDQFQNRNTVAGTQVDGLDTLMLCSIFQRLQVANCQIHNMQIIALAGAVGGIIVTTENCQLFQLASCYAANIGHQVVGDTIRIITNQAGFMGTDGVEITKQNCAEIRVCSAVVGQNPFIHNLSPAIGRGGLNGRHLFLIGMGVIGTVNRGRGRENQTFAAELFHHFHHRHGAVQVIAVVLQGLLDTFAHCFVGCKMNDCIDLLLSKYMAKLILTCAVDLVECRGLTSNFCDIAHSSVMCIIQIVGNDDFVACIQQLHSGMAADIAGATGNKDIHILYLPIHIADEAVKCGRAF